MAPPAIPVANVASVNPNVTAVDNSRVLAMASGWFNPSFDIMKYVDGNVDTTAQVDVINIPDISEAPDQVASGGDIPRVGISSTSFTIAQKFFAKQYALDRQQYEGSPGLTEVFDAVMNAPSKSEYAMKIIETEAMKALVRNTVRPNVDGLGVFSLVHPVNANNRQQVSLVTGLTIQPNLFTGKAFSSPNLVSVLASLRAQCWANGQPCNAKKFTVFCTPTTETTVRHVIESEFIALSSLLTSSDNAGSNSNPFLTLRKEGGLELDVEVMSQYPGTQTDWFVESDLPGFSAWICKILSKPIFVMLNQATTENISNRNEIIADFKASLAVDVFSHLSLAKCTA